MNVLKVFLVSLIGVLAISSHSFAQVEMQQSQPRYFTMTGTAEVRVKPNRVTLVVGISDRARELGGAKKRMEQVISSILAYGKKNGVEAKNIQTSFISIKPNYRYDNDNDYKLTFYEVNQMLSITLDNVDLYNQFIYDLLDLGVNTVQDVQFTSSEVRKYRDQARLDAIQAAKEKAELLAGATGMKLGAIVNVTENSYYAPFRGGMMANASQNISFDSAGEGDQAGSAAGMIPISATVTLTYVLLD